MANKTDEALIAAVVSLWISQGGDSIGFSWVMLDILHALEKREAEINRAIERAIEG